MRNKISKRLLISISFIICHFTFSIAQEARISGTVSDSSGPVMLCNVVEVDANNRNVSYTQTDLNGNFSMTVKNTKNKLKVSYVGSKTVLLPACPSASPASGFRGSASRASWASGSPSRERRASGSGAGTGKAHRCQSL